MTTEIKNKINSIDLVYFFVNDLEKAVEFYTKTLGFELNSFHKEFNWAEVKAPNGAILGLGQANEEMGMKAGSNAIVTMTVDNIEAAREELSAKGVQLLGDIQEVPNTCKLALAQDSDGNQFQLVQNL